MKNFAKNFCVWATALFAACMMTSCKEEEPVTATPEPTFPEVTLNNQLWYNNTTTDLKSAAYTFENELYTFYLSPTEGLNTIQEVLAADDYIIVKSSNPKGEQTAEDYSSVVYEDVAVASTSIAYGVKEYKVNVNFLEDGTLKLSAAVAMNSEAKLMVEYDGACVEALFLPELENQCQNGKVVKNMGSIVVENNLSTDKTTYYVYEEAGITAVDETKTPVITVVTALGADLTSVNLAEAQDITITVDGATPATGTLAVEILADKLGNIEGVKVVLEAKDAAEDFIRANYEGEFTVATKSDKENNLTAVILDQTLTAPLTKVFIQEGIGNYKVVCGTNAEATTPEELMAEGNYAAELTISADKVKEGQVTTVDLANTAECGFKVYDYTKYGMWDNSHKFDDPQLASTNDVKSGTVRLAKFGNKVFWDLDADLGANEQTPHAMGISSDWFGVPTPATIPDMTPVAPVVNMFQILESDETSIYNKYYRNIVSVQVAKVEQETVKNNTYKDDYYYFYLLNEYPAGYIGGVNDYYATPRIRIRKEYLGKEIDLSTEIEPLLAVEAKGYPSYGWTQEQQAELENACTTSWEINYPTFDAGSPFGNPPVRSLGNPWYSVGKVKVDFDESTKKAVITIKVQYNRYTKSYDYSTGKSERKLSNNDHKRWLEIVFDGTCEKYTGSGKTTGFSASTSADSMVWE